MYNEQQGLAMASNELHNETADITKYKYITKPQPAAWWDIITLHHPLCHVDNQTRHHC